MIAEESDSSQTVLPTRPVFARRTAGIFCVKTVAKQMHTVIHHLSEGTVLPCCQQCPHCNSLFPDDDDGLTDQSREGGGKG